MRSNDIGLRPRSSQRIVMARLADRAEIERPASRLREAVHVRRGDVDEMVDEADALGEAQHRVGQAVADQARNAGSRSPVRPALSRRATVGRGRPVSSASAAIVPVRRRLSAPGSRSCGGRARYAMAATLFRITDSVDCKARAGARARGVRHSPQKTEETCSAGDQFGMDVAAATFAALRNRARRQKFPPGASPWSCRFRPAPPPTSAPASMPRRCRRCGASPSPSTTRAAATASRPPRSVAACQARRAHDLRHLGDDPGGQSGDLRQTALRSDCETSSAVTRIGTSPFVLLVDRNSPIKSSADLTAQAQAPSPASTITAPVRCRPAWRRSSTRWLAGVDAVYVGYKSNPQAIPDVQSGLLTFMMIDTINAKLAIDRGALRGPARDRLRALRAAGRRADARPRPACPTVLI